MTKEGLNFLTSIVKEQSLENNEGVILELGPLFGSSTDAISKGRSSENPNKIVSIDTFEAAPWVKKRLGFDLSRERFNFYTEHIKNLEVIEGYSPDVVKDSWDQKIDVYFDDATHGNPTWMENFLFYKPFFGDNTIICGDDFASGWPDIVKNVRQISNQYNQNFYVIGRLWAMGLSDKADLVVRNSIKNLYSKTFDYNIHTESQISSGISPAPCWSENLHLTDNQLKAFKITYDNQYVEKDTDIVITVGTPDGPIFYGENELVNTENMTSISFACKDPSFNKKYFFQISYISGRTTANSVINSFGSVYKFQKNSRLNCLRITGL
tara:strand:+ start:391 stop:1362 length:972 start_codon:yes stop_codon:yes gene_type:complete